MDIDTYDNAKNRYPSIPKPLWPQRIQVTRGLSHFNKLVPKIEPYKSGSLSFLSFLKRFHRQFGRYNIPDEDKLQYLLDFMPDEIRSGSPPYDSYLEALNDFCEELLQPSSIKVEMKNQINGLQVVKNMKDFANIKKLYHTSQRLEGMLKTLEILHTYSRHNLS